MNLYQYVSNDPFNGVDPTGRLGERACALFGTCTQAIKNNSDAEDVGVAGLAAIGTAVSACSVAPSTCAAVARIAALSGVAAAGVDATVQIVTTGEVDVQQTANSAVEGAQTGAVSALGGRLAGIPGAAIGAYAGTLASGGDQGDALASAGGAVFGAWATQNEQGQTAGAAIARESYDAVASDAATRTLDFSGEALSDPGSTWKDGRHE